MFKTSALNIPYKLLPYWILGIVLLLSGISTKAQIPSELPVYKIDSTQYTGILDTDFIDLSDYLAYWYHPDSLFTIDQVNTEQFKARFVPYTGDLPSQKTADVYWFCLQLSNEMTEKAKLALSVYSPETRVHQVQDGQVIDTYTCGFDLPIGEWDAMQGAPPIPAPYTLFFEIDPQTSTQLFIQTGPGFANYFNGEYITLVTENAFYSYDATFHNEQLLQQAVFQGMLLMILLFNLLIFINQRDLTYLFYSLYVASIAYYFLVRMGYDRLWLWGENLPFMPIGQNLSAYGIGIFYSLFTMYFLHKEGWRPQLKRLMWYMVYLGTASAIISSLCLLILAPGPVAGNELINILFIPTGLYGTGLFLYLNIAYLRSDNQQARYFAMAGFTMFIGIFLLFGHSLLASLGLLDFLSQELVTTIPAFEIFEISCLIQILMFALALSYRSRLIEQERTSLQAMATTKSRFFANISHEFKTPLTLIIGPASDLLRQTSDGYARQMLQSIQTNAKRLLGLINEILDLSKLDAGKMPLEIQQEDLIGFSRKLTYQFQSYCDSKNVGLAFESARDQWLIGLDWDKLEKVLTNLLSNACKFTPEGGQVNIRIGTEARSGKNWISITISDTGIGIAPDHLPHLFDRFYQANHKDFTTDQPSTGIGLALTKELIELQQGAISVKSTLGKGTHFQVVLPTDLPASTAAQTDLGVEPLQELAMGSDLPLADQEAIDDNLPEILLVEDNPELRTYIRSCLEPLYQVIEAENGQQGLATAIKNIPQLIITDVMMPKMDGFTLSRELKTNEKTSHIPLIILTGKSSQTSKLEGLETAADIYLSKPFDADELRLHIRNLLSNRQRLQAHYSQRILLEPTNLEITSRDEEFLSKAIAIVEAHLDDEDFNVEQFSEALFMDRTQLFRKLRALTDQNPSTFIRNLRLKRAKQMLEANAGTVSEIAFAVGFSSTNYFIKCFKALYGDSPGKMIRGEE